MSSLENILAKAAEKIFLLHQNVHNEVERCNEVAKAIATKVEAAIQRTCWFDWFKYKLSTLFRDKTVVHRELADRATKIARDQMIIKQVNVLREDPSASCSFDLSKKIQQFIQNNPGKLNYAWNCEQQILTIEEVEGLEAHLPILDESSTLADKMESAIEKSKRIFLLS